MMSEQISEIELLKRQNKNLTLLTEITKMINATLDIGKLLSAVMNAIKEIMNTEASSLLFYDETTDELVFKVALGDAGDQLSEKFRTKTSEGVIGWCARTKTPVIIDDVYKDERFNANFDRITGFRTKQVICAPLLFKGKLIGVIQGINCVEKEKFDEEDMKLFLKFADQAVLAVQNAIFFEKAIEEKKIQNEISAMKKMYDIFLRPFRGTISGIDIASETIPAREIGGEFYDVIQFDDKAVGFILGDIHQKGVPGAISASFMAGAAKAFAKTTGKSPLYLSRDIENFIIEKSDLFTDVSFFYALYSPTDKAVEFVNSGFAYPVLLRGGKSYYLKYNTHAFGSDSANKNIKAKKIRVQLATGDILVVLTDGIINLRDENSSHFGLKRAMDVISSSKPDVDEILCRLKSETGSFIGKYGRKEDMTFICIKVL